MLMYTNLPNFDASEPAVSDPSKPPMQKMDTVKDQMSESCHGSRERPYLCTHVCFTSSFINYNKVNRYRLVYAC